MSTDCINTFQIRRASERGYTELNWLKSHHTFSFGEFQDEAYNAFGFLRILNDDVIVPNKGFATHGHQNMEIVTLVLRGEVQHQDSVGHSLIIKAGGVQVMSAGTGIRHSQWNPSDTIPLHLLQVWIYPETQGLTPSYQEHHFSREEKTGRWCLLVSPNSSYGEENALPIHQQARIYGTVLDAEATLPFKVEPHQRLWFHVATGSVEMNGETLKAGDAFGIFGQDVSLSFQGLAQPTEIFAFEV